MWDLHTPASVGFADGFDDKRTFDSRRLTPTVRTQPPVLSWRLPALDRLMRLKPPAVAWLLVTCCWLLAAQNSAPPVPVKTQSPAPPQPIPFSHKAHAALGVKCLDCHPIKDPGLAAGYPREATCMACHVSIKTESPAVQKLAAYEKAGEAIPWVKIYQAPNYVYFPHDIHHKQAEIGCAV